MAESIACVHNISLVQARAHQEEMVSYDRALEKKTNVWVVCKSPRVLRRSII